MVEIIWSRLATNQFQRTILFIKEERGKFYAELVLNKIVNSVEILSEFPTLGAVEPLLAFSKYEYRYLVVWSYKIIYRVTNNKVIISRVFHTSQSPTKLGKS